MSSYGPFSPWAKTEVVDGRFLDVMVHREIPPDPTDRLTVLPEAYHQRPDLFARSVYGTEDLWWVVPQRNGLRDPVFDMTAGKTLIVPSRELVLRSLR